MLQRLILSALLTIALIVGCTFSVTPNLQDRSIYLEWPRVVATMDATPTPESSTTIVPGTPVVFPTTEPLPALLPVVGVLNVRNGAGTSRDVVGTLGSTDCVEVDPRVIVQANGYSWLQVHVPRYGDGTWIAAKAIGGANLVRFYSGQPCVFEVSVPLP